MMKKLVTLILALLLTATLVACGSSAPGKKDKDKKEETSRVRDIFKGITEETGIHMKYSMEAQGITIEEEMYKKGDNFYSDTLAQGNRVVMIVKGDVMYMLNDSSKTAIMAELTDDQKAQIKNAMAQIDTVFETGTSSGEFTKGTVNISGKEYDTEETTSDGATSKFVFNDDGDLIYVIASAEGQEVRLKIDALDGEVKDEIFEVPAEYQLVDINGKPVSGQPAYGNDTTESPKAETSTTENTTSQSGSTQAVTESTENTRADSPLPAQGTQTVTSEAGGFTFTTGSNYIININGQYVDVYLKTQSTLPSFRLYPMMQVSGQTVDQFHDGTIQKVKENQQNKLIGEPQKVTITVGDKEIKGFTYSYSTDDGKDVVMAENYTDLIDGTFYSWGCTYMKGDNVTPAECRLAMESFKLK